MKKILVLLILLIVSNISFAFTGYVVDVNGNVIEGVRVSANNYGSHYVAYTGRDGKYSIEGLNPNMQYSFVFNKNGYQDRIINASGNGLDNSLRNVQISYDATPFSMRVINEDGQGVENVRVKLESPNGTVEERITNSYGSAIFKRRPDNTYVITASHPDYFIEPVKGVFGIDSYRYILAISK
jgi:hypothetical protein